MTPKFFDVHTHVQFAAYEKDIGEVIARTLREGTWLVNVGTQVDTSREAIRVAHLYPEGVWATVGLHPIHTAKSYHDAKELGGDESAKEFVSRGEEFDYEAYRKLAQDEKVVAIGECGLDYYRLTEETPARRSLGEGGKQLQREVFEKQIALAYEVKKPLMIHCRNAFSDLIEILRAHKEKLNIPPGIIHFMTGTKDDAAKLLELGFMFSYGGVITFARDYDEAIRFIPIERILLETDAPYVTPAPYRGKRNEPRYVEEVAKKLAELKNLSLEEIARKTTENAIGLFGIAA